jgi:cell division protein FtsW (lipid II flippase)
LQIAHEVGWLGFALFSSIFVLVLIRLMKHVRSHPIAAALFASGLAYGFYSLLIHLWSNEAVALQWWLLAGIALVSLQKETELSAPKTKRAKKVS